MDCCRLPEDLIVPRSILKSIFSYLEYEELVRLRCICRLFKDVASQMLNDAFVRLSSELNSRVEEMATLLKEDTRSSQNVIRYFKIISFLRAEHNIMKAVLLNYVEEGFHVFTAGEILDRFYRMLNINYDRIQHSFEYIRIFHLVGSYLDRFENYLEPDIIERHATLLTSWFGVKLINVLDASLDLNHRLELSYGTDCVYMEGEYDGEELFLFESLPDVNSKMGEKDMRMFIQCIRNNIKWNNLLFCIERSTGELAQIYYEPEQQINSHNNRIFHKTVVNNWKYESPGVSYAVSIKCSQGLLPLRLTGLSRKPDAYTRNVFGSGFNSNVPYEFSLIMKVRTRLEEGELKEKVIKLYNTGNECVFTDLNKFQNTIKIK